MKLFSRIFGRSAATPDPEAFFEELAGSRRGRKYTRMDRHYDFKNLFLGSEQGRRVLFEILSWGHVFQSSAGLAQCDPNKTLFHEGERNIALMLQTVLRYEPNDNRPEQANRRRIRPRPAPAQET
jgi:hypothetical protein